MQQNSLNFSKLDYDMIQINEAEKNSNFPYFRQNKLLNK